MSFKFTKNIKSAIGVTGGEMVFEFRRPTVSEKNAYFHEQIDLKSEGLQRTNDVADIRIAFYDQFIEAVYIEKHDGKREDIVGEDEKPLLPKDFPPGTKVSVVIQAFDTGGVYSKNI